MKIWTDNEVSGLKILISKGQWVVVIHIDDENCFVLIAMVMFTLGSKYSKWLSQ